MLMALVLGEEGRTSGGLVSCLMQQASSSRVYLRQGFVCKCLNKEVLPRRNLRESGGSRTEKEKLSRWKFLVKYHTQPDSAESSGP